MWSDVRENVHADAHKNRAVLDTKAILEFFTGFWRSGVLQNVDCRLGICGKSMRAGANYSTLNVVGSIGLTRLDRVSAAEVRY